MSHLQVLHLCAQTGKKRPVRAEVFQLSQKSGGLKRKPLGVTNEHGFLRTQLPKRWKYLLICPTEMHWSRIVNSSELEQSNEVFVKPVATGNQWWHEHFLSPTADYAKLTKLRIGIIDIGFPENLSQELNNFSVAKHFPLM